MSISFCLAEFQMYYQANTPNTHMSHCRNIVRLKLNGAKSTEATHHRERDAKMW